MSSAILNGHRFDGASGSEASNVPEAGANDSRSGTVNLFASPGVDVTPLRSGPLGVHIDNFAGLLSRQGYSTRTGHRKIRLVADLSRWLGRHQMGTQDLNEEHIGAFLRARGSRYLLQRGDRRTLAQLIDYLREAGVTPNPRRAPWDDPVTKITADYARFLSQQRGLSRATLNNYLPIAGRFLKTRFGSGRVSLSKLRVVDITRFILKEVSRVGSSQAQRVASPLRCFLRFLTQEGKIAANLAGAVPRVAHWRLSELPQFLEPEEVEKLLSRSHRNTPAGRRDYAVLLLLARLGLRASEVVRLELEDINWQAGEILIRGKGAREDRLPLLDEIGQALAEYLKNDRPCCACRRVFLRMNAPRQGFSSSVAVCNILGRALVRAHLHPEQRGCHLLRRSLATTMLRGGASLSQIGQVLRHQRAQTTEIYAKVDVAALRVLALPWPTRV